MPHPVLPLRSTPARLAALGVLSALLACQPSDERPGLWLNGEAAVQPGADWSFTEAVEEIFIETRPWYGIPHSTTIWCVELGGKLYIGSYADGKKAWEKAVARDPRARLQIEGRIYSVNVAPVTDPAVSRALDARYRDKYDMEEVFGESVPDWWYYRIEEAPRSAEARAAGFGDSAAA